MPKIELHRPGIEPGPPALQHINFISNRSKMTCSKMQNAKAETKIEGVDAGLNQKLGLGSSQALSWKSSDLETWIQAIQTAGSVFAGGEACGNHRSQSRHPPPQTCPKLKRATPGGTATAAAGGQQQE
jgi:hypothetical protein